MHDLILFPLVGIPQGPTHLLRALHPPVHGSRLADLEAAMDAALAP
jgi:hypothetical protein